MFRLRSGKITAMAPVLLAVLVCSPAGASPQAKPQEVPAKKVQTTEDARIYVKAMEWFRKGEAMIGTPKENSEEQAELFRKALEIKPDFIEAHFNLGLIYLRQQKTKEAAAEFEAIRRLKPDFQPEGSQGGGIHFILASCYQRLGDYDSAIAILKEGLEKNPKDTQLLRALALVESSVDEVSAIPALEALLEADPSDAKARMDLARAFRKAGRLDAAAGAYREVLKGAPDNLAAHFNLALILMKQKKNAAAAAELEEASRLSPGNADILELLGDSYAYQSENEKAAEAYGAASEKAPDRATLLSKLAFSLANLNRVPEAAAALEKSLALKPDNADAWYMLGDLYSDMKKSGESVDAYKRSLTLDSKRKEVHYNLGTLYAEMKRYQDARVELEAATELDPAYAEAWTNLAIVCQQLDLDREAIEAHEKVVALGKAQPQDYFQLGVLYAKNNQPDPSIDNFAKAIELEPERYRKMLLEELKKVHSILDSVRYKERFTRLLNISPQP